MSFLIPFLNYNFNFDLFSIIGDFNDVKELNDMSKQGNDLSSNSLLFILPESEVSLVLLYYD